ncbi:Ragulator complex protein lamtor5 [Entomortierella beljakovae]|nr:Ragulator complex protein lamtor5 [Entomortierella beljakovae]
METGINNILNKLTETEGVVGVLIADEHGLCLGARGIAKASSAGFIASIAAHAKELTELKTGGDLKDDTPTISVDYGSSTILIRSEGNHTLAVWKS